MKPKIKPQLEYRAANPPQPRDFIRLVIQVEDTAANRKVMSEAECLLRLQTKFEKSKYNVMKIENIHVAVICKND